MRGSSGGADPPYYMKRQGKPMKKVGFALFFVVIAVIVAGFIIMPRQQGSDAEQITALIDQGRQGIETRSINNVMSCISKSYKDSTGMDYEKFRSQVSKALGPGVSYEVTLDQPIVNATGDTATASTSVSITATMSGTREKAFSGAVLLHLTKEPGRKYFIFPISEWKVTRIDGVGQIPDMGI